MKYINRIVGAWIMIGAMFASPSQAAEVQEIVSKQGVRAWLLQDPMLPALAVKVAFLDAGASSDPQGKEGRAYLAGEMLLKGAGNLPGAAFQQALEEKAIQLSTNVDEDTLLLRLQTLSENAPRALELLGLALTQPHFDPTELARKRAELVSALARFEERPGFIADRTWRAEAFGSHPYGRHPRGMTQTLQHLTQEDMQDFAARYLARNRLVISVAGDITPTKLASLLDNTFAGLPARANPNHIVKDVQAPEKAATTTIPFATPQTMVTFVLPGVKRKEADFFAAYILNHILGGDGLTSRFSQELREKHGLVYSVDTQLDTMLHTGVLRGEFATRNEKAVEAVSFARALLKQIHEQGISEAELENAKTYLTGSFPLQLDSNEKLVNYLTLMQVYGLGKDYLQKRNDYMRAVTLEQVKAVSKKLLTPEKLLVVIVGPKEQSQ